MSDIKTLREYFPNTLLSDDELLKICEFVTERLGTIGEVGRHMKLLVIWEEEKQI